VCVCSRIQDIQQIEKELAQQSRISRLKHTKNTQRTATTAHHSGDSHSLQLHANAHTTRADREPTKRHLKDRVAADKGGRNSQKSARYLMSSVK